MAMIINSKPNLSQFDCNVTRRINHASAISEKAKFRAAANIISLLAPVIITKTRTENGVVWTGHIINRLSTGDDGIDRIDETTFAILSSTNNTLRGKYFATTTFIPVTEYHEDKLKHHHIVRKNWCTLPKDVQKNKPANKWLVYENTK